MNAFEDCFARSRYILLEGALGERLKREYGIAFDSHIDMGGLVRSESAGRALEELWDEYAAIARQNGLPFICTTTTRRLNRERLALTRFDDKLIEENVCFLRAVQKRQTGEMYIGALVGCRGEAYTGAGCLDESGAYRFHCWEAQRFAAAGVDFFMAALQPSAQEALGLARALSDTGMPYIVSFTLRQDGCLPDGTLLADAVRLLDEKTKKRPLCYMTNCVHPDIVYEALSGKENRVPEVRQRFLGIQANTSRLPYAQLDGSDRLYTSQPDELADAALRLEQLQPFKIFGGCCGTDGRHLRAIAERLRKAQQIEYSYSITDQ